MHNSDEDDLFKVVINKDREVLTYLIPGFTFEDAKLSAIRDNKGSLVSIASFTGKTPVPQPRIKGQTADIIKLPVKYSAARFSRLARKTH